MRFLLILTVVVCLAMPACAPSPEPEPEAAPEPVFDQAAEETAIRDVLEQIFAAYNKHDSAALLSLWTEDGESWGGTIKGRAAWEEYAAGVWERQPDIQLKMLDEISIVFVTPDVAIYKYYDETTGALDEDGNALPPSKDINAVVFVKKNEQWLGAANFVRSEEG